MTGPLSGVRVLEFEAIGPAPFACMILSDMGADVVRIGRPRATPDQPTAMTRGRRTVALDLKSAEGRAVALDLMTRAEIVIEGMRPGVMERLGLGPDEALRRNPALVYGRITGWGQTGPLAEAAGHDINYVALSGALGAVGTPETPIVPLNLVGDFGGGSMFLLTGCLAALTHARATRQGQVVDAAMIDGAALLMTPFFERVSRGQWADKRSSNMLDGGTPWYGVYPCADEAFVSIGPIEPQFYRLFLERVGLADDADFVRQNDARAFPAMRHKLSALFLSQPRSHWCALLEGTDVCFAPVLTMTEAAAHPHIAARGTIATKDGTMQPAPAPRFSATPSKAQNGCDVAADEIAADWAAQKA